MPIPLTSSDVVADPANPHDNLMTPAGSTIRLTATEDLRRQLAMLGIPGAHTDGRNVIVGLALLFSKQARVAKSFRGRKEGFQIQGSATIRRKRDASGGTGYLFSYWVWNMSQRQGVVSAYIS
jgi:hypothetical protein